MTIIRIDIDDEVLAATMRFAGERTKSEMVNLALREYAQRCTGSEARLRHFAAAQQWDDRDFWRRHVAEKTQTAGRSSGHDHD
ncbi:type II toxin-antitoxin system VapB family antitoxin [Microlunatus speluncae]|uniref:type II toxin-antitoxin system VapB family antitoxin n=1 Tax=Microlunatus speluncae TaxID=2594267 RepID=UPI0012666470|nr:type II toxin-antitoxin system VapB family antitoxin [Microlunatus speluncae]